MNYWLMKTEPDTFSYADLIAAPNSTEPWDGIRNYQARNFLRDDFKKGRPMSLSTTAELRNQQLLG